MDPTRAQTHLRRVVEVALRETDRYEAQEKVERVASALIAVGALDQAVAAEIGVDAMLALDARDPEEHAPRRRSSAGLTFSSSLAVLAVVSPPAPDRAVPVNVRMPVDTAELRRELRFLGYAQTGTDARLAVAGILESKPRPRQGRGPHPIFDFFRTFAATDDRGNAYRLRGSVGGGDSGWSGDVELRPVPPAGIRWVDLTADGVEGLRIDLSGDARHPRITVAPSPLSPGEQYLTRFAGDALDSGFERRYLPEITSALVAAGAMSSGSPVPGWLTAFCNGTGDLPERWRLASSAPVPVRAYAGLSVVLPELDGIRITLLGLRTDNGGGGIGVYATDVPDSDYGFPAVWIRDQAGWHTTIRNSSSWSNGDFRAELRIHPALCPSDGIEAVVAGNTTEIHAEIPLRWRNGGQW
jgi:hypothetical protein